MKEKIRVIESWEFLTKYGTVILGCITTTDTAGTFIVCHISNLVQDTIYLTLTKDEIEDLDYSDIVRKIENEIALKLKPATPQDQPNKKVYILVVCSKKNGDVTIDSFAYKDKEKCIMAKESCIESFLSEMKHGSYTIEKGDEIYSITSNDNKNGLLITIKHAYLL